MAMADAGKILITPKGNWNNLTTYEMLDLVTASNNIAYLARQSSVNVDPITDSSQTYWQSFGSTVTVDGETIIVDANGIISVNVDGQGLFYDDDDGKLKAALSGLSDVDLTNLSNGYVLAWNEEEATWVATAISTTFDGLSDVEIDDTTLEEKDVPLYDETEGKWVNGKLNLGDLKDTDFDNLQDNQVPIYNATTHKWENGTAGSFSEILIDYDPAEMAGITVTLSHAASAEGHTPESYQVTLNNTGEVEQDVKNLGLWTISWTHDGQSYSEEFDVHYFGYFHVMLHEGFTWRQWAVAGGIPINKYDSLAALLADQADVRRLMTIHDAVDYLCESTGVNADLATIINDNYVAKWTSLRDYAMDKMEANVAIKSAMDTSGKYGYGEWGIIDDTTTPVTWGPKGNVPIMTSDSAPYGSATASSITSGFNAYKAFDGDDNSWWSTAQNQATGARVLYKFTNPIKPKKAYIKLRPNGDNTQVFRVQASNDGTTWDTLTESDITLSGSESATPQLTTDEYYLYLAIYTVSSTNAYSNIATIQFYGRELKVSVPTMTSDTAPYGEVIAQNYYTTYYPYYAFSSTSEWVSSAPNVTHALGELSEKRYIGYKFNSRVNITEVYIKADSAYPYEITLECSDDGTIWETVESVITENDSYESYVSIPNTESAEYWRIQIVESIRKTTAGVYPNAQQIQFYGKDYSEKEFANDGSKWLYDHGVELETATAGGTGTTTKESDSLYCEVSAANSIGAFVFSGMDLSDYDLLRAEVGKTLYCASGGTAYGQLKLMSGATQISQKDLSTSSGEYPYNVFVDISSVNQTCDVYAQTANGGTAVSRKVTYKELWLE